MTLLMQWLSWFAQMAFLLVVSVFGIYAVLELRVFLISRRVEKRKLGDVLVPRVLQPDDMHPQVSVFLPVYNESAVIERLIDAVCRLRYNDAALEIFVLDDSSDLTSDLAQRKVAEHAARGVPVRYLRRPERKNYKAGNLAYGMQHARGDFFVIFDADFVPPEDFLLHTIPCFEDPRLGFLQTGIGYENCGKSFLTRFQAMEMGHQQYVTVGLSADGDMASLSGSSCVWRRSCVETLGGWNAMTVTEDVDLGYRAQFGHWKYAYLRDVVSMSVLPETVSAFRIQRERWGRGLIHSGFKHVRQMFQQDMSFMKRVNALAMMFSALLLAAVYGLLLLTLPLNFLIDFSGLVLPWGAVGFFIMVAIWALYNSYAAYRGARLTEKPGLWRLLWETYLYVAMFLPMAWYYFVGGVRALFGVYGGFHRTPKGENEKNAPYPRLNKFLWQGEVLTFFYSGSAAIIAIQKQNYFLLPINITACLGFALVLFWSWQENREMRTAFEQ